MKPVFDAFWRAAAYCLHPRVIALSILPLLIMVLLAWGLSYFFWDAAIALINEQVVSGSTLTWVLGLLEKIGLSGLKAMVAPLILVLAITPLLVIVSLLMVAFLMTPAMVSLVSERRFAQLERKKGAGMWFSAAWSLGTAVLAVLMLMISSPLWAIPPLVLVLPPLIWGWLTYRVMAFDALALHASPQERREIFRAHRLPLLGIGVVCGYLGAAPMLIWAGSVMVVFLAPAFLALAIWLYTLVFAFSSLWFAHFCLAALNALRQADVMQKTPVAAENTASSAIKNEVIDVPLIESQHDKP